MTLIFVTRERGESNYCSKIVLDRSPLNSLISNDLTHNQERERERERESEWKREMEGGEGWHFIPGYIIKIYSSRIAEQIGLSKSCMKNTYLSKRDYLVMRFPLSWSFVLEYINSILDTDIFSCYMTLLCAQWRVQRADLPAFLWVVFVQLLSA